MAFIIGEKTSWISQANGYKKEKEGIVVAIVPPNEPPTRIIHKREGGKPTLYERYDTRPMDGGVYNRSHESYLIGVVENNTKKPKLYWPKVVHLRKYVC